MGCLILKRGKIVSGVVLPDQLIMKQTEEGGCKYLEVVETHKIKGDEMKVTFGKYCIRRLKLVLKSKLNKVKIGKNKIEAINTWAISV